MNHRLTAAASLAALTVGLATTTATAIAGGPTKAGPGSVEGPARKVAGSKDALGQVAGTVNVSGRLTTSDLELPDGSRADPHTAIFTRGQRVRVDVRSNDFDAYLLVLRVNGEELIEIGEDDDSGGGLNARVEFTVTEPGEYTLLANGVSATDLGAYDLQVTTSGGAASGNSGGSAAGASMTIGQTRSGQLDTSDPRLDDNSYFEAVSFEARRGQTLDLAFDSDSFDPVLSLYYVGDEGPELLSSDDDSGGESNARIRVQIPYSGNYIAVCNGFGPSDLGPYQLSITAVSQTRQAMANADWATLYPGGGDPNEQYAVLVGIDDYPGVRSDLASCVVDTREMHRALTEVFGFREENIIVINDGEATRDHIMEAMRRHLGQAGPGGTAFFYFSGHGLQLDFNAGVADAEADGKDEAIYVWGEDTASSVILDEELGALLDTGNAGRRVAVLDSCHSGTGTLGPSYKWVSAKDPWVADHLELPTEYLPAKSSGSSEQAVLDGPSNHVLLAACGADQVASAGSGGRPSVFTYFLVREMEQGGANQTFTELMTGVRTAVDAYRADNTYVVQIPQLEGSKANSRLSQFFPKSN